VCTKGNNEEEGKEDEGVRLMSMNPVLYSPRSKERKRWSGKAEWIGCIKANEKNGNR
jgi:hypothetical protein